MKRLLLFLFTAAWLPAAAQVSVSSLKVNHMCEPSGVVDAQPVLSWIVESPDRNVMQQAYEVRVFRDGRSVWRTGRVESQNSVTVAYDGEPLASGTRYEWQVRVWDNRGRVSKWSERSSWLTGMMTPDEWQAEWILPAEQTDASPMLRKEFTLSKPVASAVAYITSHGMYEAAINGAKVGNAHYAPGWTSYDKRLQYQTYDVTDMLQKGANAFGLTLGRGWYLSLLGWSSGEHQIYAYNKMAAIAQIVITYRDGTREVIATDDTWKSSTGEIVHSTIYDGETIDARLIQHGWNKAGFDDSAWRGVTVADYPMDNIVSSDSEPVVTHEYRTPVEVITTPKGEKVLDFGQNMVGREIFTFKGRPGQEIVISHAEVLDENGNFYTINLRSAKAQSRYICSGGEDRFEASFTFYGFRYLKVEGLDGEIDPDDFKVAVIFSDLAETGSFSSSNDLVNQLQSNIQWGLRGNFVDIPTDCPQRDERLGWAGDAQVFFRTATFNRDVQSFFRKWLKDVSADQLPDGQVTDIIPMITGLVGAGHTGWADVATIVPWQHYMAYGDKRILENQFPSMKAWVDFIVSQCSEPYLWNTGWHYGDWLFYSVDNDTSGVSAVTYKPLIQQCFFANSADVTAKAAAVLGLEKEAAYYADVAAKAREAFCNAYLTPAGYLVSATQTAYVLALNFDMLPESMRPVVAARLADKVREYGHITTGFLGTPYICHVLSEWGYTDLAYMLLLRQQYPGWLYPVTMGATTIWERWNSMMPDRTIPNNGMNSFNHYSYGAIGDWLYRDAVGLHETSAGFKTMAVKPHTGGGFTQMRAEQITPYGRAAAEWRDEAGVFTLEVTIPVNTTAEIYVPSTSADGVMLDGAAVSASADASLEGYADGYTKVKVGSGTYRFEVKR